MEEKPFVIAQFPNKYLWIMIVTWMVSYFTKGPIQSFSRSIFYVSAIIWSYEEIVHGINWFRQILGLAVMISVTVSIFMTINH